MPSLSPRQIRKARRWMTIVLLGLFIFIIGVQPDILGLNRSQTVGFVQIGVWLTGFAILLLASYATVHVVRNGKATSLRADIGLRLLATGYVVVAVASLADFIGVGAQRMPFIAFGPVQVVGLVIGVLLSLLGIIFYWPRLKSADTNSTKTGNDTTESIVPEEVSQS